MGGPGAPWTPPGAAPGGVGVIGRQLVPAAVAGGGWWTWAVPVPVLLRGELVVAGRGSGDGAGAELAVVTVVWQRWADCSPCFGRYLTVRAGWERRG